MKKKKVKEKLLSIIIRWICFVFHLHYHKQGEKTYFISKAALKSNKIDIKCPLCSDLEQSLKSR